jgi:hypothetical protein
MMTLGVLQQLAASSALIGVTSPGRLRRRLGRRGLAAEAAGDHR